MNRRARLEGSSFLRWTLAFSALASIAACGAEAPEWVAGDTSDGLGAQNPRFMPEMFRPAKRMPDDLRAAYVRSVQSEASDAYSAQFVEAGAFQLKNATQSFQGTFSKNGVELEPHEATWSFSLRTTAMGCEGALSELEEARVEAEGNRIRYVRTGVEEWYLNGPLGLEQGFVLETAPACKGVKVIQMQTGGDLHAEAEDEDKDGRADLIRFVGPSGTTVVNVSGLYVKDAQGQRVPAWMTVDAGNMSIVFDDADAMYPLDVDPLIAVLEAKILNPATAPSTPTNNQFGYGLSFSGNRVLVSAPKTTEGGRIEAGCAYVFERVSPGVWVQQGTKLVPSDSRTFQWFGFSAALSGDTAVLSAPFDGNPVGPPNTNNPPTDQSGAAYVFVYDGINWVQQAKLKPTDNDPGDLFGVSAAIAGDRIVIGASGFDSPLPHGNESGAAYTFTRSGGIWSQEQTLTASDGEPGELFGTTVTVSSAAVGVGSVYDDDQGFRSGSMYMYARNGGAWVETQKLLAPAALAPATNAGDLFGYWAAISSDTMVVSAALYDDDVPNSNFGAAFVYVNDSTGWNLQQKLTAQSDRKVGDWFGSHVAIDGNSILVGAQQTDEFGTDSGAAYWFIRTGTTWNLRDKLLPTPGAAGDRFGWTVGASGNLAAVGAPFDDTKGTDAGAVYIFIEKKTNGEPCNTNTECASNFCIDGVCCDTLCGGGATDDCQACSTANGGPVNGTCSAVPQGKTCRPATGSCDIADTCNGTDFACPTDRKVTAGTVCRTAADLCDVAEKCDGVTNDCPTDAAAPAGTECRPSVGGCDVAESCNGVAPACPPDVKVSAGTTCRVAAGACDTAEVCDGISGVCPNDGKFPAGVECRPSAGDCDAPEICDGTTDACPEDQKIPSGTQCRGSAGACDSAEACDGVSNDCPVDTKLTLGTLCRASNGICDQPETCDGVSDACPNDGKSPAGVLCRAAAGSCDLPETCDGLNDTCPVDAKPPAGTVCRASAGLCDVAETCDGVTNDCPMDGKLGAGTACRLPKGLCDEIEFCDGASNNCPVDKKTTAGVFCRAPKGLCDEPEACDGINDACPQDQLTEIGIPCRPAEGACDVAETCTGVSAQCPANKLVAAGVECRESQGSCDIAETCNGTSPKCPTDSKVGKGIPCRASGGECDQSEVCDGNDVNCPVDDPAPDGTVCSAGVCREGVCTEVPPVPPPEYSLYGGGPVCQTNPIGSSSSPWAVGFLALALGSLRRRFRPSKH